MAFEEEDDNVNTYRGLEELNNSDWEIKEGEPDITGWSVFNSTGDKIGEVEDLLFDAQARKVRYIILELHANGLDVLEDRTVLVPIGVAELHENDDDVVLPLDSAQRLVELPEYETGNLTPETEVRIRDVFEGGVGSTAQYQHPQFYAHAHFNEDKFYNRNTIATNNEAIDYSDQDSTGFTEEKTTNFNEAGTTGFTEDGVTDLTEEDPEDEAARAERVSRIVARINNKEDNV